MVASQFCPPASRGIIALLLCVPWGILGCGYHLTGTQVRVPGGVRSVHVGKFENHSREFGLDLSLAAAFEREFYRRGVLKLVEGQNAGEAELTGTIREFRTRPVAFDAQDEALQYEAELLVDVKLSRRIDGEVLWQASGVRAVEEYSVAQAVVVPSSSQFQRGTLDLTDLARLSDIQLAETEKRLALERLVGTIVTDVHDRILDDF
jgi:Lipopolysaccharide-assembly